MSDEPFRATEERPPPTAEDLKLLATPSEELRKQTEVFSFDQDRFKARVSDGERWQQLLQAHLYYDHVITRLLVDALVKPDAISATRMSFLQKLQLINALGLLSDEIVSTVELINKLRNKIAHRLDFEISDKDVSDLRNTTPKRLRDLVMTEKDREAGPIRFHELLWVVLLQIEVLRQKHAFDRVQTRKGHIRLQTVLDRTKGAVYRE